MASNRQTVVVVGAGIIGLTTAVTLLERHRNVTCTVVASCLPDDEKSIDYASPWAGAHHVSHAKPHDTELAAMERETFKILMDQYRNKETGSLMLIDQYEHYTADADNGSNPEGLKMCDMPGMRDLRSDELPDGIARGVTFQTLTIDTPPYLRYLARRFERLGGTLHRAKLSALNDVTERLNLQRDPLAIINCTGLGSLHLEDVQDGTMFPTRGQLCVIRAPWMKYGKTFAGKGMTSYTIPRSSGLVIVGGTRDAGDWHTEARPETTKTILERALAYDRNILPPEKREKGTIADIDLVETGCGRRPSRKNGVRLELDRSQRIPVLHNYGHSGFGWQSSYAYARKAVDMLDNVL